MHGSIEFYPTLIREIRALDVFGSILLFCGGEECTQCSL